MFSAVANQGNGPLEAGVFYFCGGSDGRRPSGPRLPATALRYGWHPVEHWGRWAARRESQLSLHTPFRGGTAVLVAASLQVPPGSSDSRCVVRIGEVDAPAKRLGERPSWLLAEGVVSDDGRLRVTFQATGRYGRPDPREIYLGLRSVAFCSAEDEKSRQELIRKATITLVETAKNAVLRAISPLRVTRRRIVKALSERRQPEPANVMGPIPVDFDARVADLALEGPIDGLAPELAPRPLQDLLHHHAESIDLRQPSRRERTHWGLLRTFRGVEAVRGFCISSKPISHVQILIGGRMIRSGPVLGGYRLKYEINENAVQKYVFNVWHDFGQIAPGRYELELLCRNADQIIRSHREQIVVAAPLSEAEYPSFDGVVSAPDAGVDALEQTINARPSMIRPARRAFFETPPRNVLVVRVDQLGDMVVSVPGVRRLREILPEAHIVALLTAANADLARSLGFFDEIIVADFPDDHFERRRIMPIEKQVELKNRLAKYKFDLAIDLAASNVSRPLLLLSGARLLFGFSPGEFPWLTSGFEGTTRNLLNGLEVVAHGARLVGLIEWLGATMKSRFAVTRRSDLRRERLSQFGIGETDRFAVIHTGARLKFSRWPNYGEFVALLLERTDLKVVVMADDPEVRSEISPDIVASKEVFLIDRRLSFDDFDALVSFCDLFVGNDSGPKHLASLRGANVISTHLARNNWNEWGQEEMGYIVSRRVPCAGCNIFHDPEECGKDYACITNISAEEVFGAAMKLMISVQPSAAADAGDGGRMSS